MTDLRHPAKSLYQNELNLEDEIIASEEDYHKMKNFKIDIYTGTEVGSWNEF